MNKTERDAKIASELVRLTQSKKAGNNLGLEAEVETLFSSHIWGHREIVATIIVARILDSNYKASANFYGCNPRAVYEGPIRSFFIQKNIPHMKSGPLNVAKNISKINEDWALNKRGNELAMSVVTIVNHIEKTTPSELEGFANYYFKRYLNEAQRIKKLVYKPEQSSDPFYIANLSIDLINDVPAGGSIPQFIVGSLIEATSLKHQGKTIVSGHTDSVSTTNTTSKKAGDVTEDVLDGSVVYEITVKKFDHQRILDSYESLRADKEMQAQHEVVVICRPEDVYENCTRLKSESVLAFHVHNDVTYFFIDIFEFIKLNVVLLDKNSRSVFLDKIVAYVNQTNTPEKVKTYFKKWHQKS